jgi:hypothetical protein
VGITTKKNKNRKLCKMVTARKLSKALKAVKTITPNYSEIKNSNKK